MKAARITAKKIVSAAVATVIVFSTIVLSNPSVIFAYDEPMTGYQRYEVEDADGGVTSDDIADNVVIYGTQPGQNPLEGPNGDYSGGYATSYLQQYSCAFNEIDENWSNVSHAMFSVSVPEHGEYNLVVGYRSEPGTPLMYIAAGTKDNPQKIAVRNTARSTEIIPVTLDAGENVIYVSDRLTDGAVQWVNIDYIDLSGPVVAPPPIYRPAYYNGGNEKITALTDDALTVRLPWENTEDREADLTMVVAVYSPEDRLIAATEDSYHFARGESFEFEASLSLQGNEDGHYADENYYAKVFLWENFMPVVPAWTFRGARSLINPEPATFMNPLNLGYQYQFDAVALRECADPTMVYYKGEYYLFASKSSGYWVSEDLANWTFIYCENAQMNQWAPAPLVLGDYIYLTHSEGGANIYRTNDPKNPDAWTQVRDSDWGNGDPAFFEDEDGKVYIYYGLSGSLDPIYGVELDPDNDMAKVGEAYELFYPNPPARGFEVPGDFNTNYGATPWVEGAWMTKHDGKYYLQYSAPGTEMASYANGTYIGESPLGPFKFSESSPVSYKGTGFVVGAGHGATFEDHTGNLWKIDTVSISVNGMFERRLLMYPAQFDQYGQLVTNTVFADYPMYTPFGGNFSYDTPRPDWQLLSYGKTAGASSSAGTNYSADKAFDESMRTWWSAASGDAGEWLSVDLGKPCDVNAFQINFADHDTERVTSGRNNDFRYQYLAEYSLDGEEWFTLVDNSAATAEPFKGQDTSHDYYELLNPTEMRYIRVTNCGDVPAGGKFAISGLRVFGDAGGDAPDKVETCTVSRPAESPQTERTAIVEWDAADGAEGYIVRFGNKPDSLNHHYQVIGETSAEINILNMGVDYWFTVDAYNESGYTPGTAVTHVGWTLTPPPDKEVRPPMIVKEPEVAPGFAVFSAENLTRGGNATLDTVDNAPEGGRVVGNMHNPGAFFETDGIDGGIGGGGYLRLCFSCGESSAGISVTVNGSTTVSDIKLPNTGSWNPQTFKVIDIPITGLTPGDTNTVRVTGGSAGFNSAFIQVIFE